LLLPIGMAPSEIVYAGLLMGWYISIPIYRMFVEKHWDWDCQTQCFRFYLVSLIWPPYRICCAGYNRCDCENAD